MNTVWKLAGAAAAVLTLAAVGLVAYGSTRPTTWQVEVQRELPASPDKLRPFLACTGRYTEWMNGVQDPDGVVVEVEGPPCGPGAIYRWSGNGGQGELKIVGEDDLPGGAFRIRYEMVLEAQRTPAAGWFSVEPRSGGAWVVWHDAGELGMGPVGGLFAPMMQKMLTEHFEVALAVLGDRASAAR
jgi:hypothetical protein